jgi:two-component system, LuxR family, sensor kinase FixL
MRSMNNHADKSASTKNTPARETYQLLQGQEAVVSEALNGTIIRWNAAAERLFGYAEAEALGQHISIVISPDRLREEDKIMERLRAGADIQHHETFRRHKDGSEFAVSLSARPVRDETGAITGASTIVRAISGRTQPEDRLHELQDELSRLSRLGTVGQVCAAITHELNQPLTAITNYIKAAQRLLGSENPQAHQIHRAYDALEKAAGQTARAGTIVRYMREFIDQRELARTPEDINEVIREAVTLSFTDPGSSNVEIALDLDRYLPLLSINKVQILQVLTNLIRNSLEAMSATRVRELTISSERSGQDFVRLVVWDTGAGLTPDILAKLFQPFIATQESGIGIGLKICQSLIEAHDGTIRALPDVRSGAAFEIKLPVMANNEPG